MEIQVNIWPTLLLRWILLKTSSANLMLNYSAAILFHIQTS